MSDFPRWSWWLGFTVLGCVAAPGSDGSSPTDDNQRRAQGAEESGLSFVDGLPCNSNGDCGRRFYCKYLEGQCAGEGTCETRPRGCTQVQALVCGCDDRTHSNACAAAGEGVNVQAVGECPPPGEKCGSIVCDNGLRCCNASCGICVPDGGVCTQEVCE